MSGFRGLTWDHPRGRNALEAAARDWASRGLELSWDVHPLEGFESSPIEQLAERYDLIVLDHPHLGDALASSSLRPVDGLFGSGEIETWAADTVGPSLESYRLDGRLWALPLDAATQVSARRGDLVPAAPRTWDEVLRLSREQPVALSLAGPHAFLTFCSVAVSLGEEPDVQGRAPFVSRPTGLHVLEILSELAAGSPAGTGRLNPIELLQAMTDGEGIAYCPLVYGYVNYSRPHSPQPVVFGDAPESAGGGPGSTIGGTGIAVTARCLPTPLLLDHLRWLMDRRTQATFIPARSGQPSARSAWLNGLVNAAAADFYRNTLATIERSWVRPRFAGYIPFQSAASALLRRCLLDGVDAESTLQELDDRYSAAGTSAPAERSSAR
jgi:multiple sugar transport system substrate-binding protein